MRWVSCASRPLGQRAGRATLMSGDWLRRLAHFSACEAKLAEVGGFHPVSPFWRDTVTAIFAAQPLFVTGRVGRRGGKSSTWCRLAVSECTAGTWHIPPDDVPSFLIMSADREQAADRIRTCAAIAEALGVEHEPLKTSIRFPAHGTEIRVRTASVKGAVSATSIGAFLDEVAVWADDRGANPASEVIDMLMPSMLTQPGAFAAALSAPWTTTDPHAVEYDRLGDGRFRFLAATWDANPSLQTTKERCRALSRTEAEFLRQYGAQPLDAIGGAAFPPSLIRKAMGLPETLAASS